MNLYLKNVNKVRNTDGLWVQESVKLFNSLLHCVILMSFFRPYLGKKLKFLFKNSITVKTNDGLCIMYIPPLWRLIYSLLSTCSTLSMLYIDFEHRIELENLRYHRCLNARISL